MFGTLHRGALAYAKVGVETGIITASPHRLVMMLFEGAQAALQDALVAMKSDHSAEKNRALSKAISIIESGLRGSLDNRAGGDIAASLDALYAYMATRLLEANRNHDAAPVKEVHTLLQNIKSAWEEINASSASHDTILPPAPCPRFAKVTQ